MMADIPEIGKISADIFSEIIFPRLGADDKHTLVGPRHGTDVGIVEIAGHALPFGSRLNKTDQRRRNRRRRRSRDRGSQ